MLNPIYVALEHRAEGYGTNVVYVGFTKHGQKCKSADEVQVWSGGDFLKSIRFDPYAEDWRPY